MPRHIMFLLALAAGQLAAVEDPEARDPWLRPFARTSIWNTPIGSGAVYVPASLPAGGYIGIDVERHIRLAASDPQREVYPPSSWGTRWPGDHAYAYRSAAQWRMPVPDALIIPDAAPPSTPNACTSFLMPDGRELRQLEPACRAVAGAQIVGWPAAPVDLYGSGIPGTHWGSGLSVLGGSIRVGEMAGAAPLRHALKINLWGKRLYFDTVSRKGYRWPATTNDSAAATTYQGANPALRMGSLLAIPPGTSAAAIGVSSVPGRKLFAALQDYGAYVSDDSGWDAHDLCAETGVSAEVQATWGLSMTGSSGSLVTEIRHLVQALQVVDNNSAASPGGGGTPRQAPAPRLADPALAPPTDLRAAGGSGAAQLSWALPAAPADGVEVQRRPAGGDWAAAIPLPAGTRAWNDAPAAAGSAWEYRVRLVKEPSASAWSASATCAIGTAQAGGGSVASPAGAGGGGGGGCGTAAAGMGALSLLLLGTLRRRRA